MTEQTKAIIKNTEAILKASGTGLDRVVKVVVSDNSLLDPHPILNII